MPAARRRWRSPTISRKPTRTRSAREREETKRLLYVALTRARDRLYLSATVKDGACRMGRAASARCCRRLRQGEVRRRAHERTSLRDRQRRPAPDRPGPRAPSPCLVHHRSLDPVDRRVHRAAARARRRAAGRHPHRFPKSRRHPHFSQRRAFASRYPPRVSPTGTVPASADCASRAPTRPTAAGGTPAFAATPTTCRRRRLSARSTSWLDGPARGLDARRGGVVAGSVTLERDALASGREVPRIMCADVGGGAIGSWFADALVARGIRVRHITSASPRSRTRSPSSRASTEGE